MRKRKRRKEEEEEARGGLLVYLWLRTGHAALCPQSVSRRQHLQAYVGLGKGSLMPAYVGTLDLRCLAQRKGKGEA